VNIPISIPSQWRKMEFTSINSLSDAVTQNPDGSGGDKLGLSNLGQGNANRPGLGARYPLPLSRA
jgi:hypothetical protein